MQSNNVIFPGHKVPNEIWQIFTMKTPPIKIEFFISFFIFSKTILILN